MGWRYTMSAGFAYRQIAIKPPKTIHFWKGDDKWRLLGSVRFFPYPLGGGGGQKRDFLPLKSGKRRSPTSSKIFLLFLSYPKTPYLPKFWLWKIAHKVVHHHPTRGWVGEVAQSMACNISKWSLWWIQLNTRLSFVIQINRYSTAPSNGTNLAQAIDGAVLYLMVWIAKIMHKLSCIHHKLHCDILQANFEQLHPSTPCDLVANPSRFPTISLSRISIFELHPRSWYENVPWLISYTIPYVVGT